ncbi:MAG: hypothetical protein Q8Q56_05275, partial [Alphaproteobacteria bacterium]|nr:hypothetical protein [Alphaproteobacteria bacterium]
VKVALIVSQAEFEAVRTKGLRDVMKHIRLFPPEFLESSLSILLTKATPEIISDGKIDREWFMRYISADASAGSGLLSRLVDANKVRTMPQVSERTPMEVLQRDHKELLERHLRTIDGRKLHSLHMGMTLSTDSTLELQKYFSTLFLEQIRQMVDTDWKAAELTSAALSARKAEYQRQLLERVERSEGIVVLKPLGEEQFRGTAAQMMEFPDGAFNLAFTIAVSRLEAKEHEERAEQARKAAAEAAERERIAKEAEATAIKERKKAKAAEEEAKRRAADAEQRSQAAEEQRDKAEEQRGKAEEQRGKRKGPLPFWKKVWNLLRGRRGR